MATDVIEETLPVALQYGISFKEFWHYSLTDIKTICESYNEKYQNDVRIQAMMCYNNALLVKSAVASCFDKSNKFPQIHEIFPNLFEAPELKGAEKVYDANGELVQINIPQQDPEVFKEILTQFAEVHNRKYQDADN